VKDRKKTSPVIDDGTSKFEAEVQRARAHLEAEREARLPKSTSKSPRTPKTQSTPRSDERGQGPIRLPSELFNTLQGIGERIENTSTGLRHEIHNSSRGALRTSLFAIVIAALGVGVAIYFGMRQQTAQLERQLAQTRFTIDSPRDRSEVRAGQIIRGSTPYPNMNHYVLITVIRSGSIYVQKERVFINADGAFSGEGRFDDLSLIDADPLKIQVIATPAFLGAGKLADLPGNAYYSDAVTVTFRELGVANSAFVIMSPQDGATVGFDYAISGKTPFPERNHYIVITPVRTGTAYVQDRPADVDVNQKTFVGRGRFGATQVGIGQQFMVYVVATKSALKAGPLLSEPEDAARSNTITVTRR